MDICLEENNYEDLLNCLKSTVESLLGCHPSNIWDVYGGIQRLYVAVTKILKHGFRFLKDNGEPDFWVFIQGLCWLQPTLAASPSFLGHPSTSIRSPLRNTNKAMAWLYKSIENHSLSEKLSWLLSDHEHLLSCYKATAFLRQIQYSEATLICLRAVERREINLLTKIDPPLYLKKRLPINKKHRRCFSYPESKLNDDKIWSGSKPNTSCVTKHDFENSNTMVSKCTTDSVVSSIEGAITASVEKYIIDSIFKSTENEKHIKNYIKKCLLKRSYSSFDVYLLNHKVTGTFSFLQKDRTDCSRRRRSVSDSTSVLFDDQSAGEFNSSFSTLLQVRYNKPQSFPRNRRQTFPVYKRSDSSDTFLSISSTDTIINKDKIITHKKRRRSSSFFKLPFQIWESTDDEKSNFSEDCRTLVQTNAIIQTNKKKSFIENGGNITLPVSMGSYPKPSPGQSIMSFLLSGVFTHTNAELDRENAHFNISEALIAALEQMKSNQQLKLAEDILEESDEEINELKRIIRIRRQQKQKEKQHEQSNEFFSTDSTLTTDQSVNSLSSSAYSTSESISTDQDEEENSERINNLLSVNHSGLSVSKLSVTSDNTINFDCQSTASISAESVAISLLRRFKENQLPAASEIEWLVSERDAPQKILPIPSNIVNDEDDLGGRTLLRGTLDWAPPRPQIIFTLHPPPVRRQILEKQAYRCAGCGTKVAQKYASKFRYCEYLGRYFCTACHSEQTTVIPGHILQKWDFVRYPVSNFSYQLLDQMSTDPLFNVMDVNASLYRRSRALQKIRLLRISLFYLKDFIFTCKYTERLQNMIKSEPNHIYTDPDCYSLVDFINVKNNKQFKRLSEIVKHCENHMIHCQLCQARGFMCEICKKQEIIFPWQLSTVLRCKKCGSCHHIKCFKSKQACPKCNRITNRNELDKIGVLNRVVS